LRNLTFLGKKVNLVIREMLKSSINLKLIVKVIYRYKILVSLNFKNFSQVCLVNLMMLIID